MSADVITLPSASRTASLKTTCKAPVSPEPGIQLISGVKILPTIAVMIAVNAPPIMIPTAISSTFPRVIKSLNSLKNLFISRLLPLLFDKIIISELMRCQANIRFILTVRK